jgi:hypothetical protein
VVAGALDDASLSTVVVEAVDDPSNTSTGGQVLLSLRSKGPDPLVLLGIRIDREGYPNQRVKETTLRQGIAESVFVDLARTCPKTRPLVPPTGLLVRVRTRTGAEASLRVPIAGTAFAFAYEDALEESCDLDPAPDQVVGARLVTLTEVEAALHLTYELRNRGTDGDVLVTAVQATPGFKAEIASLPLELLQLGGRQEPIVILTVTDCDLAARSVRPAAADPLLTPVSFTVRSDSGFDTLVPVVDAVSAASLRAFVARRC